jgi:pyruvate/2-oxoglutarate dehydrogenase complex dihydrolipoamide dehydrogenase (E3) component
MKFEYDLLVIGGGAAGLTAAGMGANFGAKTLMIEADKLGGDCTWHGCIPSKTLLHTSKVAHTINEANKFGFEGKGQLDFSKIMGHIRDTRQAVYEDADDPEIFRDMGVDIAFGRASFVDDHTVTIPTDEGQQETSARFIVIATGSKAMVPPIDGLNEVTYHTNETIFELEEQPKQLAIIGGGPIGTEMAQAFQRLGTQVTVFDMQDRILSNDDPELADMLCNHLRDEGVQFKLSSKISSVSQNSENNIVISGNIDDEAFEHSTDVLLMATGRAANYSSLGLDNADINYTKKGITVNDRCRTNKRHIYAAGDVTGRYQFTHMSEHMAKVAVTNALLKVPMKIDQKHITWTTFTDPELAHVGATEQELQEENISYKTYRFPYDKIDRAITDGATVGLIKIFAKKMSGKILGATVLGKQGGELISEYAVAMRNGVTLRQIADTIHPYPSYGLGARRAADQWYVQSQSTWMVKLLKWIFGYRGEVPDLSDENRIV